MKKTCELMKCSNFTLNSLHKWNVCKFVSFALLCIVITRLGSWKRSYPLGFTFPSENLYYIVHEIETVGHTTATPLNNITKMYKVLKDPAKSFCTFVSCDKFQMLFLVKSFVGNFAQRTAIRQTWGNTRTFSIKTIFVVGRLGETEEHLKEESNHYKDILQFDLTDKYENLVYKTIFTMMWLSELPINMNYIHFIDDDRLVNTENVYRFALDTITNTDLKMIGYVVNNGRPKRNPTSKWFLSLEQYPYDYWPQYIIGGTILTNIKVVNQISKSFSYTRIIPIEDAFIGILCKLLGIEVIHNNGFLPHFQPAINLRDKLSSPGYNFDYDQLNGWRQLAQHAA